MKIDVVENLKRVSTIFGHQFVKSDCSHIF